MWYFHEHPEETGPADFKLATLCQYFGVAFHAASAHEAVADVSATVALYQAIRRRSPDSDLLLPVRSRIMPATEHPVRGPARRGGRYAA
jgi:exonuclease I